MTRPPDPHLIMLVPAIVLMAAALTAVVWLAAHAIRCLLADKAMRPMLRLAWRIRHTWPRTARRVGLIQVQRTRPAVVVQPAAGHDRHPRADPRRHRDAGAVRRTDRRVDRRTVGAGGVHRRRWAPG